MKRRHQQVNHVPTRPPAESSGKWVKEGGASEMEVEGMDELLAVLGYKVKTSEMADVASKLEQLEEAMMKSNLETGSLLDDSVHCNPSDLSNWLESMLTEFNTDVPSLRPPASDYDLTAIPGDAVFPPSPPRKRLKSPRADATHRPVILVDSQENGIRLVHLLLACAEAVQASNFSLAEPLVKQIGFLAASQAGAMGKVATFFAKALSQRIYQFCNPSLSAVSGPVEDANLQSHFYEWSPYLKFAHFTANQAILESFEGCSSVHVIDFSMNEGHQWPALMQALALRPGGPPRFRLTGIGPPAADNSDHLQKVGWKLATMADVFHLEFEYRGFVVNSLADLNSEILELRAGESIAVNSVFELHKLLACSGALEKVLSFVKKIDPVVFTVVEQEANHNGPDFLDRFTEALHYYSTLFDSIDGSSSESSNENKEMSELYLGKQILNVIGCEGEDRVERHEILHDWKQRLRSTGFSPVCLGSNAFKQASMLLDLSGCGDGYRVEEADGCLLLGWHTRPLIATSAWRGYSTR